MLFYWSERGPGHVGGFNEGPCRRGASPQFPLEGAMPGSGERQGVVCGPGGRHSAWGALCPTSGAPGWSQPCTHVTSPCAPLSLPMHYEEPRWTPLGLFLNEMLSRSLNIRQEVFSQALAVLRSAAPVWGREQAETRCPTATGTRGPFRSKTAVSFIDPAAIFNTDALLRFK